MTILERFQLGISQLELYPKDDPLVDKLLNNMAKRKIVHVGKKGYILFYFVVFFFAY